MRGSGGLPPDEWGRRTILQDIMAETAYNVAVWAALAGNLLVAATKFVAAAVTGSAATVLTGDG